MPAALFIVMFILFPLAFVTYVVTQWAIEWIEPRYWNWHIKRVEAKYGPEMAQMVREIVEERRH